MIFDQDGQPLHESRRKGLPRLGKIRTGSRDAERGYPKNQPTFRIEPEEQGRLNTFMLPWQGSPKKLKEKGSDAQWKMYERLKAAAEKATASLQSAIPSEFKGDQHYLRVWLPREDPHRFINYSYKLQMGGRKLCQCDGRTAKRYNTKTDSWARVECEQEDGRHACEQLTNNKCRMRMNLGLRLPWLGWYETAEGEPVNGSTHGVWQIDTGSWGVLGSIFEEIEEIRDLHQRLTRVPVMLFKLKDDTKYKDPKSGQKKTGKNWFVHLGPWAEGALEKELNNGLALPRVHAPPNPTVRAVVTEDTEDVEEELTKGGVAQEPVPDEDPEPDDDPEEDLGDGEALPLGLSEADAPAETANAAGGW